jgi:Rrf2 family protein
MRLSTRVRYGVRAMLELALQADAPSVSSQEVGARQRISPKYVGQLLAQLRASGLVRSVRGQGGGFRLARPPGKIRLLDVVRAFEGSLAPVPCVDDPATCQQSATCAARDLWCELKESVEKPLARLTLADLARRQRRKASAASRS